MIKPWCAMIACLAITGCSSQSSTLSSTDAAQSGGGTGKTTGAICTGAERIVYSCSMGSGQVTVCAGSDAVTYRYGTSASTELEIVATASNGKGFAGAISGGGGGQQRSVRFVNNGHDYVVYSANPGSLMDVRESWSGLTVYRGDRVVLERKCEKTGAGQRLSLDAVQPPLPDDTRDIGWQ